MIRLLMADDHSFFMDGVMTHFAGKNITVVGRITDPTTVLSEYQKLKPDVVLCDAKFTQFQETGFGILKQLLEYDPAVKFIMYSQFDQDTLIQQSYDDGAKSFLTKFTRANELIEAITEVNKGEVFFTKEITKRFLDKRVLKKVQNQDVFDTLTKREIELLRMFGEGLSDKEIADHFNLHVRTITTQKTNMKEKFQIVRNTDFTRLAIKHNLISIDPSKKRPDPFDHHH